MQLKAQCADHRLKTGAADSVVSIRQAEIGDARRLAVLMSQLGYPTREEEMAARLRLLFSGGDYLMAVALREGRVVGMVAAMMGLYIEMNGRYGRVTALSVAEDHRGQGIGALLLAYAESWLHAHGAVNCIVNSSTHRSDAHRFYKREGYQVTGVRFHKDFRGVDPETHPAVS